MKDEILLTGNITDLEIKDIQSLIPESNVIKIQTKGLSPIELIQLVFNDFNLLTFTRDFVLGGMLTGTLSQVKSIIKYFESRKKPLKSINIEVQIKKDNTIFSLYISTTPENLDLTIESTGQNMNNICNTAENNSLIQVMLSKNGKELEIDKI